MAGADREAALLDPMGGRRGHADPAMGALLGQTVSALGTQNMLLALPLTAVVLKVDALQMGLRTAAVLSPWLLIWLAAVVWVCRLPRWQILIASDLGRAVLPGSIPLAAFPLVLCSPVRALREVPPDGV